MQAELAIANLRVAHEKFAGELMVLELATQAHGRGPAYKRLQDNAYYAALKLRKEIDMLSKSYGLTAPQDGQAVQS